VKRISAYLLILLIFCCVNFISVDIHAAGEEDSSLSLSQGVKSADEESVKAKPIQDEDSATPQEDETKPAQTLENTQTSDTFEDASLSVKKETKESLSQKDSLAELRAYVDKSSITIGEKVTYTLEIDADNDLKVEFLSYVSGLGGFVVKDFGKDEKRIGRHCIRKKQWYLLDTYTTGSYVIPEQRVAIKLPDGKAKTLKSPQIFVEVKSVIDDPIILIVAVVLIILTAAGIISWKLYLKKIAARRKEPVLTPHEIAFRELERIESLKLIEKSKIKEYYYLVSLALRTYLENRFCLKAPEQTTEEFLESVVRSDKLKGKYVNILKEYLSHCDLVKYAKFDPGKAQAKSLIETTRRFIEETAESKEESNSTEINRAKI